MRRSISGSIILYRGIKSTIEEGSWPRPETQVHEKVLNSQQILVKERLLILVSFVMCARKRRKQNYVVSLFLYQKECRDELLEGSSPILASNRNRPQEPDKPQPCVTLPTPTLQGWAFRVQTIGPANPRPETNAELCQPRTPNLNKTINNMATPQRLETVRRLQTAMATAYGGLGAW